VPLRQCFDGVPWFERMGNDAAALDEGRYRLVPGTALECSGL
jgi:hypothetical protein